jgi:tetratricopeptide (TPR) repeat protein
LKRYGVSGLAVLVIVAAGAWIWLEFLRGPRVVEPGAPLRMGESVQMRWVDEETGEEDVWKVTKRETTPEELTPSPLPEPDPAVAGHEPSESSRALHAMALESWKRGEIGEAMSQLEQAIEMDPEDPLPRTQYGRLQTLAMDFSTAMTHLERAAELAPDEPQVWLDLATLYQKRQMLERSWEARRRADALADGREIYQDERSGFWVIEGTSIYP